MAFLLVTGALIVFAGLVALVLSAGVRRRGTDSGHGYTDSGATTGAAQDSPASPPASSDCSAGDTASGGDCGGGDSSSGGD